VPAGAVAKQGRVGSKPLGYLKTQEGCMPTGKVKMFNDQKGFGFIRPDDGSADVFFHVSACREGDVITEGKAVNFESGPDPKSGKIKAITVDLS
jgi:CspA family cold shock protein